MGKTVINDSWFSGEYGSGAFQIVKCGGTLDSICA